MVKLEMFMQQSIYTSNFDFVELYVYVFIYI